MKKNNENVILVKKILKLIYFLLIMIIVMVSFHIFKTYGFYLLCCRIMKIIIPFLIGLIIAWILKPILDKLKIFRIPPVIGSIMIYFFIFGILILLFKFIIPDLNSEFGNIHHILNDSYNKINQILLRILKNPDYVKKLNAFFIKYARGLLPNIMSLTKNCINYVFYLLVGLVIGLYALINYDVINSFILNCFPPSKRVFISSLMNKISNTARSCVNGTFIVAFFVFLTSYVAFLIIKVPHPLIYSLLCGITDIIPYIGPYIGGIPVVIIAFGISTKLGYMALITCVIIQLLENYLYGPLIMSHQSKLNPLLIIFGLLLFGNLFGIIGLVIATPIMSIIKVVIIELKYYHNNQ